MINVAISDPDVTYRHGSGRVGSKSFRPRDPFIAEREKRLIHLIRCGIPNHTIARKLKFRDAKTVSAYKSMLKKKGFNLSFYD